MAQEPLIWTSSHFTAQQLAHIVGPMLLRNTEIKHPMLLGNTEMIRSFFTTHHIDSTKLVEMNPTEFRDLLVMHSNEKIKGGPANKLYHALKSKVLHLMKINADCKEPIELLVCGHVRELMLSSDVPESLLLIIVNFFPQTMRKIKLQVHDHRSGSSLTRKYHPRNLLDGNQETFYCSPSQQSDQKIDWITFVMHEATVIIPRKVRIRNIKGCGPRTISLFIGTGDASWLKLVDNIYFRNEDNVEEYEHEFAFDALLVSPRWIWKNKAKYIRMVMADPWTKFAVRSFSVSGMAL